MTYNVIEIIEFFKCLRSRVLEALPEAEAEASEAVALRWKRQRKRKRLPSVEAVDGSGCQKKIVKSKKKFTIN